MGFRTVVIKNRSKLDLRMNYLVCRSEEESRIYIPEISYLILESTAISLTSALLSELIKNNVKIIFCDEKHNPESELVGLHNNYSSVSKIKKQMQWSEKNKASVWQKIIQNKIYQQKKFLEELGYNLSADLLGDYLDDVMPSDITNREGHSAKVYFNAIFGQEFQRREESNINGALNYGYAVMLACFNREIVRLGYLTQLGIWHKNEFNYFNLSCDLFEPFRILVDREVLDIVKNPDDRDFRLRILDIFKLQLNINGKRQYLENAISIYCQSVLESLNNEDMELLRFYEL